MEYTIAQQFGRAEQSLASAKEMIVRRNVNDDLQLPDMPDEFGEEMIVQEIIKAIRALQTILRFYDGVLFP